MKIYKILSDIYFLILYAIGVLYNPQLLYLTPLIPLLIFIFHHENSLISSSASVSMCILNIFVSSLTYLYLATIPLIILSIEASYREGELSSVKDIRFKSLGVSSIYLLSITSVIAVLSISNIKLITYSITSLVYLILKNYIIYRDTLNVHDNINERYVVIRDHTSSYIVRFSNRGRYRWRMDIKHRESDGFKLVIRPYHFILSPGSDKDIIFTITGSKIGSYKYEINIQLTDPSRFINRILIHRIRIVVKPKLDVVIAAGRRLLEAYGGEGVEEYAIESQFKSKGRFGEFSSVRIFIPGDDPRHIHFKKSVEHQKLVVKEYEATGYTDIYLISDIGVGNPEDLDTVLYNTVSLIINYLVHDVGKIGLIMFNSEEVILRLPPTNPIYILKKLIEYSDVFRVYEEDYSFILDQPDISIIASREELARIEYELIDESYRNSILSNIHSILAGLAVYPSTMILIKSNSRNRNLYPIFQHNLEKIGHDVREFKGGMELELEELARYIL